MCLDTIAVPVKSDFDDAIDPAEPKAKRKQIVKPLSGNVAVQ